MYPGRTVANAPVVFLGSEGTDCGLLASDIDEFFAILAVRQAGLCGFAVSWGGPLHPEPPAPRLNEFKRGCGRLFRRRPASRPDGGRRPASRETAPRLWAATDWSSRRNRIGHEVVVPDPRVPGQLQVHAAANVGSRFPLQELTALQSEGSHHDEAALLDGRVRSITGFADSTERRPEGRAAASPANSVEFSTVIASSRVGSRNICSASIAR